eukprot:COSAG01_NODE_2309_length_7942_cov_7.425602_5_plen_144_part_00
MQLGDAANLQVRRDGVACVLAWGIYRGHWCWRYNGETHKVVLHTQPPSFNTHIPRLVEDLACGCTRRRALQACKQWGGPRCAAYHIIKWDPTLVKKVRLLRLFPEASLPLRDARSAVIAGFTSFAGPHHGGTHTGGRMPKTFM